MKPIPAVVVVCLSTVSMACSSGGPTAPADAMGGTYIGSTSKADIRLEVEYVTPGCSSLAECLRFTDNLQGSGSITMRATGEMQSFQLTGFEAGTVGITFHQSVGVMLGTRLFGSASPDGRTVQAFIYATPSTAGSELFGDSVAISLSRQ